jgi:hypothetical protein
VTFVLLALGDETVKLVCVPRAVEDDVVEGEVIILREVTFEICDVGPEHPTSFSFDHAQIATAYPVVRFWEQVGQLRVLVLFFKVEDQLKTEFGALDVVLVSVRWPGLPHVPFCLLRTCFRRVVVLHLLFIYYSVKCSDLGV